MLRTFLAPVLAIVNLSLPAQEPAHQDPVRTTPPAPLGEPARTERMQEFLDKHPRLAAEIRREADRDGDGQLDASERARAMQILRRYRLDKERWQKLETKDPEAARRIRALVDRDGDGRIEPGERGEARRRMNEERSDRREERRDERAEKREERRDERAEKRDERRDERTEKRDEHSDRRDERRERAPSSGKPQHGRRQG
jgi:hypothetical protein